MAFYELVAWLIAWTLHYQVCCQTVSVSVPSVSSEYGTTAQLSCHFSISPRNRYIFKNLVWSNGTGSSEVGIANFVGGVSNPMYINGYGPPRHTVTRTDSVSNLTMSSVTHEDAGTYSCQVYFQHVFLISGTGIRTGTTYGVMTVYVPPQILTITYESSSYSDGASFPVVAGIARQFVCTATGITPAATFVWSGTGTDVPVGTPTQTNTPATDPLMDSTSTITVDIPENPETLNLECRANNTQDGSNGACIAVTLEIRVPPKAVKLSDANGDKTDGDPVTVDEGTPHTFTCLVQGTRPAATVQWLVDNVLQSAGVGTPTQTSNNGLYDTTGTLTFTPSRADHRKELKCEAYTAESQRPYPDSTVTLAVNGPPDTPIISGVTSPMTEDDVVTLTCVADMGYPNDWILNLTRGTQPAVNIPGTATTSSASGNRYRFTSMVDFKLNRADNGNNITCTTGKDSGVIGPAGTTGPLNVQSRPKPPDNVNITNPTEDSLTVVWEPGQDGGNTQHFQVGYLKKSDSTGKRFKENFTEGTTTYTVMGLEPYTEYEISVYAINAIGENYNSATGTTLPETPNTSKGFIIDFDSAASTVKVDWPSSTPRYEGSCIQLEVKYQGNSEWQKCGNCITSPQTVTLSTWCSQQQRRKQQTTGGIVDVQAKLCYNNGNSCGPPLTAKTVDGVPGSSTGLIIRLVIGIVAGCLFLSAVVILIVFAWRKRRKRRNTSDGTLPTTTKKPHGHTRSLSDNQSQKSLEMDAIPPSRQAVTYMNVPAGHRPFPRDQMTIIKELGHGAFGVVFLAEAIGIVERSKTTLVAVKSVKERAGASDKANLIAELETMKKLPDHHNVIKLLGFCVQQDPPYIIVEYLSRGNLKDLLADSRSKGDRVYGNLHGVSKSLTSNDLMKFAVNVADGMHFISSQQCIHRDLAARNVLMAEDMTCKVSDFGLARDVTNVRVYERTSEGNLPLRWMALESILYDTYTTESDIWSYGVLLWEIVTLGARPYPEMSAKTMIGELQSGYRMPKPQHCRQEIYDIMLRCWEEDPDSRPKFEMISTKLNALLNKEKECISVKEYEESIYEVTLPEDDNEKV